MAAMPRMGFSGEQDKNISTIRASDYGLNPTATGPIALSNFISTISKSLGIEPRSADWKNEVDAGLRGLDYDDLRLQYQERAEVLNFRARLDAAGNNSLNSFLYLRVCPMRFTNEMNFSWSDIEVYQAPFDEMNPLNIARTTGYRREFHSTTLKMYKRSMQAEGTLLADAIYGPQAMSKMTKAIDTHAELTMIVLIINALVEFPYWRLLSVQQDPVRAFNHSRQVLFDDPEVYSGAESSANLISRIIQGINDANRHNTAVGPVGMSAQMALVEGEPKEMMGWQPIYDTKSRTIIMEEYQTGIKSAKSFPTSIGSLDFFELHTLKGYSDDPDDIVQQPLRGLLTHGELIQSAPVNLDDLESDLATVAPKMLDVLAPLQTPGQITFKRLAYREYLKSNVLFLDEDGGTLKKKTDSLSPYYEKLAQHYNDADNLRDAFQEAFRSNDHTDNNNASNEYLDKNFSLENMTGFRHFDGFLHFQDTDREVAVPKLVGYLEPKTMPPQTLFQMAKVLHREIRKKTNAVGAKLNIEKFLEIFPSCLVTKARVPQEANMIAWMTDLTNFDPYVPVNKDRSRTAQKWSRVFARNVGASDSMDAFVQSQTPEQLQTLISEEGTDVRGSRWSSMLAHIPDEGVPSFLKLLYVAHRNDAVPSAEDEEALEGLMDDLEKQSLKAHAIEIIKEAANAVSADPSKSIAAAINERKQRPWISTRAEKRANEAGEKSATLALAVQTVLNQPDTQMSIGSFRTIVDAAGGFVSDESRDDADRMKESYSFAQHKGMLELNNDQPLEVRTIYVLLLLCRFNFATCDALARYGLCLFRQNYLRIFITQSADSLFVLQSGYETWFLAHGHGRVVQGIAAAENSWAMHAQFHMGVVPQGGAKHIRMIPYVFPREHFGGRTCEPIRHPKEADQYAARDRRSIIVLPTPVTEERYEWPVSIFRENVYRAPDLRTVLPTRKISFTDILRQFLGIEHVDDTMIDNDILAQFYAYASPMATHVYPATVYRPLNNHPDSRDWGLVPGLGALNNPPARCAQASGPAFMGRGSFAKEIPQTMVA
jgi:hypothetical protein